MAALLIGSAACNRKENPREGRGGGVDGGGGDFIYNTREEVLAEIERNWKLLQHSEVGVNPLLIAHTALDLKVGPRSSEEDRVKHIIEKCGNVKAHVQHVMLTRIRRVKHDFHTYLPQVKMRLIETDACNGPGDHRYVAAVSRLDRSGELCLSLKYLTQRPSASLGSDLLALMVHEIAHLNGFDESDARLLQKFMLKRMNHYLRKDAAQFRQWVVEKYLTNVSDTWRSVLVTGKFTPQYFEFLTNLKNAIEIEGKNLGHPLHGDDISIARPEKFEAVTKSFERLTKLVDESLKNFEANFRVDSERAVGRGDVLVMHTLVSRILDLELELYDYYFGNEIPGTPYEISRFGPLRVARQRELLLDEIRSRYGADYLPSECLKGSPCLLENPRAAPARW